MTRERKIPGESPRALGIRWAALRIIVVENFHSSRAVVSRFEKLERFSRIENALVLDLQTGSKSRETGLRESTGQHTSLVGRTRLVDGVVCHFAFVAVAVLIRLVSAVCLKSASTRFRRKNPTAMMNFGDTFLKRSNSREFDYLEMGSNFNKVWSDAVRSGKDVERWIKLKTDVPINADMSLLVETIDKHMASVDLSLLFPLIVNLGREITGHYKSVMAKFQVNPDYVELTRAEVACVLANCFLCTFPHSYDKEKNINFSTLYDSTTCRSDQRKVKLEKIKCILAYFNIFFSKMDDKVRSELITYKKMEAKPQNWPGSQLPMGMLNLLPNRSIFDVQGCAQVDFANKRIGGGVLGNGSLQEEIRFITCPELIVARLFSREMRDSEAIEVCNFLQYAQFSGYGDTFHFAGVMDDLRFMGPHVMLAMDALDFSGYTSSDQQYNQKNVDRELLKAFAAFSGTSQHWIATGNWGGGCFKGDPILKASIMMIAAAQAEKVLFYCPFESPLFEQLQGLNSKYQKVGVGEAYKELLKYCQQKKQECLGFKGNKK